MRHLDKLAKEIGYDIKKSKTEDPKKLMRIALALSGRIALLEKFIDNETKYEGQKVGFKSKYGANKED